MGFWRSLRYDIEQRWPKVAEKFQPARQWLNDHPGVIITVTVASVFIMFVVTIAILIPDRPPRIPESKKAWFYDLNTNKLFVDKLDKVPPVEAPSGPLSNGQPAGVKAYVLTYVSEPNEAERFIGFLETADPNAQKSAIEASEDETTARRHWGRGMLIRTLDDERWVPSNSGQGRTILIEAFRPNENGERPIYCPPE